MNDTNQNDIAQNEFPETDSTQSKQLESQDDVTAIDPPNELSKFEKRTIRIQTFQTVILALTFLGALWIGFQQNVISQKQNELSEKLVKNQFAPSIQVSHTSKGFKISNYSREKIWFHGYFYKNTTPIMAMPPILINPSADHEVEDKKLSAILELSIPTHRRKFIPLNLFIESADGNRYTVKCEVLTAYDPKSGKGTVKETHVNRIIEGDWNLQPDAWDSYD